MKSLLLIPAIILISGCIFVEINDDCCLIGVWKPKETFMEKFYNASEIWTWADYNCSNITYNCSNITISGKGNCIDKELCPENHTSKKATCDCAKPESDFYKRFGGPCVAYCYTCEKND